MNATITTADNRTLSDIPVKEGCTRVYVGSWAWTETGGFFTEAEAEEHIPEDYRKPHYGSINALDVPHGFIMSGSSAEFWKCVYHPDFPHYLSYRVGSRSAGIVTEEKWEG
jgi:hypothetical protein